MALKNLDGCVGLTHLRFTCTDLDAVHRVSGKRDKGAGHEVS